MIRVSYLLILLAVTACSSINYSYQEKDNNSYTLKAIGSPNTSITELKTKLSTEAKKLCQNKEFVFIKNFVGEEITFSDAKAYGNGLNYVDNTNQTAIVDIQCID